MLKRLVSAVVGVTCIAATVGVSAVPSVATSTVYNGTEKSKITVKSTVQGASGDIYTYLAYDKSVDTVTSGDQIVYIDQQTATGTTVTFTYVTDKTDVDAKVKVGGKNDSGAFTPYTGTIPAAKTSVNVTVDGEAAADQDLDLDSAADDDYVGISLDTTGVVSGVTIGGTTIDDYFVGNGKVWIKKSDLTSDKQIAITTTEETAATEAVTIGAGCLVDGNIKSVIAMAKVVGAASEYGIVISTSKDFSDATYYPALGKGTDGVFAIKLQDIASGNLSGTVYAKAYYGAEENRTFSDKVFEINTDVAESTSGSLVK